MRNGRRAAAETVLCVAALGNRVEPVKVGVTATKKVGTAVARNRAKRRLREAVREEMQQLAPGVSVVLSATGAANGKPFQVIRADVAKVLVKTGAGRC